MADEEVTMPIQAIYRTRVRKMNRPQSTGMAFTLGFNQEERVGKKTEGESANSNYVDGKAKGEGQRRDFGSPPA